MTDLSICTVAGHRMAYRRSGHGEPLLLVHGVTTNSFIWNKVAPALSEDFDVIAIDLLGCGGSDLALDLPTLILRGDGDIYLSAEICERLHSDSPGSRLQRLATAGHYAQIDEPDWIEGQISGFIREISR